MGISATLIPPPVDLEPVREAAEGVNGRPVRRVSVGSWRNYGKAPHKVAEWGARTAASTSSAAGSSRPRVSQEVSQDAMPALLAQYETFVFLPTVIEPFGRLVAEAWAAGCELVVNEHVGAATGSGEP
jgi:glycosyltransferase involved in cell wall biosynthesis